MSQYQQTIREALPPAQAADAPAVEILMRGEHPTLDHLTRAQIRAAARRAAKELAEWRADPTAAEILAALMSQAAQIATT